MSATLRIHLASLPTHDVFGRPIYRTPIGERLRAQARQLESGCLVWTGHLTPTGYGVIKIARKSFGVHTVAFNEWVGPVPDGMEIDHTCRVRNCILPNHLEPVTHRENLRRARARLQVAS